MHSAQGQPQANILRSHRRDPEKRDSAPGTPRAEGVEWRPLLSMKVLKGKEANAAQETLKASIFVIRALVVVEQRAGAEAFGDGESRTEPSTRNAFVSLSGTSSISVGVGGGTNATADLARALKAGARSARAGAVASHVKSLARWSRNAKSPRAASRAQRG